MQHQPTFSQFSGSVGGFCLPIPTWARAIRAVGFRARASEHDVDRTTLSHRTAGRDLGYASSGLVASMAVIRSAVALAALPSRGTVALTLTPTIGRDGPSTERALTTFSSAFHASWHADL
jgi:hypothetical protein